MQHRDKICIQKIIKEIDIGREMLGDISLDDFLKNEMLKRAVSMTVINVGELVKTVTFELRDAHHEVPWKAIAGMRDITAHRYQTLRMEDVYETAVRDFPTIKNLLGKILEEDEDECHGTNKLE
ncbi:MAG: DUF86 domain-containing protein [Agathobacter sp.]|nr:DUF86 domain-containing protein [Agathobacter sp.]MDY4892541.1 HepT-like ribonuclease domain-containing protein [Agathobacter sp.]